MIPQPWPLFATLTPTGRIDDEHVRAIISWESPAKPGNAFRAQLVALGPGELCGEQRLVQPDMVWPTAEAAATYLAERRVTAADPPYDGDEVTVPPEYTGEDIDDNQPPHGGQGPRKPTLTSAASPGLQTRQDVQQRPHPAHLPRQIRSWNRTG